MQEGCNMSTIFPSAKKRTESYVFGSDTRWIHAGGAEKFSHQMLRGTFELVQVPESAVMLAMAVGYAEITVNGSYVAALTERSYLFDRSYEAYDVSPYLKKGKNVITVLNIDTGDPIRTGFALEIQNEGKTLFASDASWVFRTDDSVDAGADYFICTTEEIIYADRRLEHFADVDFDDTEWRPCEVIEDELLHVPYERIHQSRILPQSAVRKLPSAFSAVMTAEHPAGIGWKLGPSNEGVTCIMACFTLDSDTEITFLAGGLRAVSMDGMLLPQNQRLPVKAGEHFLMIAFSWSPELFIRTEAKLAFSSPFGEGNLASCLIPVPPVRYPWNEYRGRTERDERIDIVLAANSFEGLPEDIRSALVPYCPSAAGSVLTDIISRSYSIPKDGFADEKIRAVMEPSVFDGVSGLTNREALFREEETAVFAPTGRILNMILDFGTEQVGCIELLVDAPAGTVIECHAFEMITDGGINYMGPFQTMRYICRDGLQHFISRRRRGFRYLSVLVYGNASEVKLHDIRVIETRYPVSRADFSCSDETLCRVYEMAVRTAEVCMLDLYVDCPGYEQNPWTGDARVTGLVNLTNFGAFDFDEHYLRLIAESLDDGLCRAYRANNPRYQAREYLTCACFPTYPEGCIPVWSFMWALHVYDHYLYTGNLEFLREMFTAVRELLSRCEKMTDDRGLFDMQGAWNLIEWANNDLTFYGEVTANNVMLSYCFAKSAEAASELGETALAAHYREMAARYRDAVNHFCWDENHKAYVDTVRDETAYDRYCAYFKSRDMEPMSLEQFRSQSRISVQSNTMALLYDCVPEERVADASRFLIDNIKTGQYVAGTPSARTFGAPSEEEAPGGYVHVGSPFFLFFALKALYQLGEDTLALTSQRRDWGEFLRHGLTTCVENFLKGKNWTRSVAHAWSASPALFLMTEVLGVKPMKPGFSEFSVSPKPGFLAFAKGTVPTPHGPIHVEWHKKADGTLDIRCTAPEGCRRIDS